MAFDGNTWTVLPGWSVPSGGFNTYTVFEGDLVVGGGFQDAAGIPEADGLVRFDGTTWHSFATAKGTPSPATTGTIWVHKGELITNGAVFYPDGTLSSWRRWGRPRAGVSAFGSGTAGCAGLHTLGADGTPTIGTPDFTLRCNHAPASSTGLVLIADVADTAGSDPLGIGLTLHLSLASSSLLPVDMLSDASGVGESMLGIPNVPAFVGATLSAQALWFWPLGTCSPSPFGLSSSNGLALVFQP
jgi:hypothetical protein